LILGGKESRVFLDGLPAHKEGGDESRTHCRDRREIATQSWPSSEKETVSHPMKVDEEREKQLLETDLFSSEGEEAFTSLEGGNNN